MSDHETGDPSTEADLTQELPEDVIAAAERLTRLARRAADEAEAAAYREDRDDRLAEYGFTARVREEDAGEVLVLHPGEWVEEGTIRIDRIEDTGRAIERRLSGPGEESAFERVDAHNREVVARIEARAGPVHAANATAFADFMGNHYARRVETATPAELREFLAEYFPRNAFPTDEQRATVEESLRLVFAVTDREAPEVPDVDPGEW
ncbi:MAG: rnhA operon protein [Halobacteriales archaeon]